MHLRTSLLSFLLLILIALQGFTQNFNEIAKVVSNDRDSLDWLGYSVDIDGDLAVVGSWLESHDSSGGNFLPKSGAAYLYQRDNLGNWSQIQKLVADDRTDQAFFGKGVAISGGTVIVGSPGESFDENGMNYRQSAGAAYVFELGLGNKWEQIQKLVSSDRQSGDSFGDAVSVQGDHLLVGASGCDIFITGTNPKINAGAGYIFERSQRIWSEVTKASPPGGNSFDFAGQQVAISENFAVVGVSLDDIDSQGNNPVTDAGSAYIYQRISAANWMYIQKITPSVRGKSAFFGISVATSGSSILVGASGDSTDAMGNNPVLNTGAAYMFKFDSNGQFQQIAKLVASDREFNDQFGHSVSLSGNVAAIGARYESESGNTNWYAGAVYIFEKPLPVGNWTEFQKVIHSDRDHFDEFGGAVSLSGNRLIVGAIGQDEDLSGNNYLSNAGSAYIFEGGPGNSRSEGTNIAVSLFPNPTPGQFSLSIEGSPSPIRVEIYNPAGKRIADYQATSGRTMQMELEGPAGLYLVRVQREDGKGQSFKLIKR